MTRLSAAAAVLLLHGTARADMGMPWPLERTVSVRITLTVDPPPPGVVYFIQDTGPIRRLPAESPIRIESPPGAGAAWFTIYAVPAKVVEGWSAGVLPHRDWFGRHDNPDCKVVGAGVRGRVGFNDSRSEVVAEYRVGNHAGVPYVVRVSENAGSGWYRALAGVFCGCALPLGIVWLGVWLVRRLYAPAKTAA